MKNFVIFLIIGTFFGLYYSIWGDEIFDTYNPDSGFDKGKKKNIDNFPASVFDIRIDLFSENPNFNNLGLVDLILFILGYIGINGRLPTIAHNVQNWFPGKK